MNKIAVDLTLAEAAYRNACRRSNLSLGRNSRDEIIDLVNVRDRAYAYIALLEKQLLIKGRSKPLSSQEGIDA